MFSESSVLRAVKEAIRNADIKDGKPVPIEKLTEVIAASIYMVISSSDYVQFVAEEMSQL